MFTAYHAKMFAVLLIGGAGGDYSDWATSLSADGSVIAIGAYRNKGNVVVKIERDIEDI